MKITLCIANVAFASSTLFAQLPAVNSLVNSATFTQQLSPGSIATLFGSNLASSTMKADVVPLPTALADVRVSVCAPGSQLQCTNAPLLFVSPSQINFVIPATGIGNATATVINESGASTQFPLYLRSGSPGIFHMGWDCAFPAVCPMATIKTGSTTVQRGSVVDDAGMLVTSGHPLQRGRYYSLYVTGLGTNSSELKITLAGVSGGASQVAIVPSYIGPSTCEGLQQVNFTLPDNASDATQPAGYTPLCSSAKTAVSTELRLTITAGSYADQSDAISVPVYLRASDIACQP